MGKTKYTKEDVLDACRGSLGIIENARQKLGVSRDTFWDYRKRWPEVQKALRDEERKSLDFAESKLQELIRSGDFRAISFFLERRMPEKYGRRPDTAVGINVGEGAQVQAFFDSAGLSWRPKEGNDGEA